MGAVKFVEYAEGGAWTETAYGEYYCVACKGGCPTGAGRRCDACNLRNHDHYRCSNVDICIKFEEERCEGP